MLNRILLAMQNSMLLEGEPVNDNLKGVIDTIMTYLNWILVPILAFAATIAMIYVIVIVAKMARADSAEAREEAKKKIIYSVVGIVIGVFMIILLVVLRANLSNWLGLTGSYDPLKPEGEGAGLIGLL